MDGSRWLGPEKKWMCGDTPRQSSAPFIAVDLFAGAGGFSLGAIRAGLEVRAAVEHCRHASHTYCQNIHNLSGRKIAFFEHDIMDVRPAEVMITAGLHKGTCDLLLGGPPCQGFSSHRLGDAGVGDPRNKLLLRYFEFVEILQPKVFLLENVPGLLHPKHADYLQAFLQMAREHDYRVVAPTVLNARDYGVPQNRRRVFILGIRKDLDLSFPEWPPKPTHCTPVESRNSDLSPWRTASIAFKRFEPSTDPNDIHMNHGPELIEVFRSTPPNGGSRAQSNRVLPCHKKHNGHKDVYGRISVDKPAPTMTTACINPSKGRFVHPYEHHGITVRQAARLQTFPDDFVFSGGIIASGAQIGNAVPVELARILCEFIVDALVSE